MALVVKDRVKETTTSTGTGTVTLGGAASGYQSFSVVGDGNTTYYSIIDAENNDWEVGLGTYTASGTTLSRDTVLESSNSGSLVNFSAGTKTVFSTYPAEKAAFVDDIPTNNNELTNGAGYITGNQTITLSGDASGSGTTSIAVTVADDSHNHVISNVDGLQSALDAKQATITGAATTITSADLATSRAVITNASGKIAASSITSVEIGYLDGASSNIQTQLNGKQASGSYAVTTNNLSDLSSASTARSNLGLGSLATLSTVNAATITDNSVGAAELNVSGNGTTAQFLRSDGDGTFTWATPTDTNTTYSADGNYGMTLSGTAFRLENDRRRNATGEDIWSGNTHDFTHYDASVGIRWYTAGAEEMRLENDGDLHVDADVIAYSTTVSDRRLKTNIAGINNALAKVSQLNGYTFEYIKDGKISAGVIAQEVEAVLPEAVSEKKLPLKADDDKEYKVVNYDALHGLLIEAVKELTARVEELEAKQ